MKATFEQAREWTDRRLIDINGEKIGTVNDLYNDDVTGEPEWLQVKSGLFGTHTNLVPVAQVRRSGDDLMVSFTKDRVREAPQVANNQGLSSTEQRTLYEYYGLALATPPPAASSVAGTSRSEYGFEESGPQSDAQDAYSGARDRGGFASDVSEGAQDTTGRVADTAQNLGGKAADLGGDAARKTAGAAGDVAEGAKDVAGDVAGGIKDVGKDIGGLFHGKDKDAREASEDWNDERDWDFPGSASEAKDQLREHIKGDKSKGKRPPEPRV